MSLLLCVHMNIVFLLLSLHFAIGLLEESDLDVVANELDAVSRNWYRLGQALLRRPNHYHLDSIRSQCSHNEKLCLRQTVRRRMGNDYVTTTWSDIVVGVRSSGDSQLADHLHSKYCSSEFTTT